jgi:hypothetical protein
MTESLGGGSQKFKEYIMTYDVKFICSNGTFMTITKLDFATAQTLAIGLDGIILRTKEI